MNYFYPPAETDEEYQCLVEAYENLPELYKQPATGKLICVDGIDVNEDELTMFMMYLCLRQHQWQARFVQKTEYPWSPDDTLNTGRFCNVYSFLDRHTQYLVENILERERVMGLQERIFHSLVFRVFNQIEVYNHIKYSLFDFNRKKDQIYTELKEMEAHGPLFSANGTQSNVPVVFHMDTCADLIVHFQSLYFLAERLAFFYERECISFERSFTMMTHDKVLTGFMANMCAYDMCLPLEIHKGRSISGGIFYEWVKVQSASRRAIKTIFSPVDAKTELKCVEWIADNYIALFDLFGIEFPYLKIKETIIPLSLYDIEHSLGEYDKYVKFSNKGHIRSKWLQDKEKDIVRPRAKCLTLPYYDKYLLR